VEGDVVRHRRLSALLLLVAACRNAEPERDPGPEHLEAMTPEAIAAFTDHSLEIYDALATAAERAGDDCGRLAEDLGAIVEREGDTLAEAVRLSSDPAFQQAGHDVLVARAERTAALAKRMETAFERCGSHPEVARLLAELE
jgi:hypothetical protein